MLKHKKQNATHIHQGVVFLCPFLKYLPEGERVKGRYDFALATLAI